MVQNKNYRIYYFVSIFVVLFAVVGFSFAYFASNETNNAQIDINLQFDQGYAFSTTHSNATVNASITSESMYWQTSNKTVYDNTQTLTVNLKNDSNKSVKCTYALVWVWDSSGNQYTKSSGATNEFTVKVGSGSETQLPNYNTSNNSLATSSITANAGASASNAHSFNVKFYNLTSVNQEAHANKVYKGTLKVTNVSCAKQ